MGGGGIVNHQQQNLVQISKWRNGWTIGIGKLAIQNFEDIGKGKQISVYGTGFSPSPSLNGIRGGQNEQTEDEIAENIFDWWISGKSYSRWYADKYLQGKLNFKEE